MAFAIKERSKMDYTTEVTTLWNSFVGWLPKLLGVIGVLIIGLIVAMVLRRITVGFLRRIGIDRRLQKSPASNVVRKFTDSPSETIGKFIYWLIVIITITIAISVMNIPVLNQLIAGVYGYVPNILAAILILALALAASTAISGILHRLMGDTPTGKIVSTVVSIIILSISGFAILVQLKIAPSIVTITYIALLGSLALGFAIAFGLGATDVSRRLFDQAYHIGQKNIGQARRDIEKGKERGKREADEIKRKIEEE